MLSQFKKLGPKSGILTLLRGFLDKHFYLVMALLCVAIKVSAVLHPLDDADYDTPFHPATSRPLILWFHNAAFSAWLSFFVFQSALVRTRRVNWHRFLGWFGAALGTAMVPIGIATAIVKDRIGSIDVSKSDVEAFLIVDLYQVLAFGLLFALAIWWREMPEIHRRLIFIATCGLLANAFSAFGLVLSQHYFFACVDLLIFLGVLRDLIVDQRVHKVYFVTLPALIGFQAFAAYTWLNSSAWWMRIAQSIVE